MSSGAMDVLQQARSLNDGEGLIFPSPLTGKPLSDAIHCKRLREAGVMALDGEPPTVHGFRSAFRDWASEKTDYGVEVMEAALAHVKSDKVQAAYARSDLLERQRPLMEEWGEYVAQAASD